MRHEPLWRAPIAALRAAWRSAGEWGPAAAIAALAAFAIAQTAPFASFDRFSADVRISRLAPPMAVRDDIVLIAITDETLDQFSFRAPINRAFLAALVAALDARGAEVIALDILLDKPTIESDDAALEARLAQADADIVLVDFPSGAAACTAGADSLAPETVRVLARFARSAAVGDGALCEDRITGVVRATASRGATFAARIADAAAAAGTADAGEVRFAATADGRWPFPAYPAHHVDSLPADWIAGRIALIGAVTPFGDRHETPLRFGAVSAPSGVEDTLAPADTLPGVLVHAFAAAQRLDGARAPRLAIAREAVLALIAGVLGALIGAGDRRWWVKALLLAGVLGAYWLAAFWLFAAGGPLLGLSAFSLALALSGGLTIAIGEQRQRRRSAHVRRAFEHYLAPDVVDELVRDPDALTLAAQERDISVIITDLEGFSRFIDRHDPDVATDVINSYLDRMIAITVTHGGAVDKIVGDSVHALFSAPVADPHHRRNAMRCALAMSQASRELQARFAGRGLGLGRTRIGVHAGRALVGNFGASRRFDYTAHGSTVNIAARLEAANKAIGTCVCVSAAARVEEADIVYRTIGDVLLRGFDEPITLFEPVAAREESAADAARYETALAEWPHDPKRAVAELEEMARARPDPLVAFQLARAYAGRLGEPIAL